MTSNRPVSEMVKCEPCEGTGCDPSYAAPCDYCLGTGEVAAPPQPLSEMVEGPPSPCPVCGAVAGINYAARASSQAPSDARDNCVLGDDCPNRAIPPAVASDDWLVRQLEAWPARVDPEKTTNIEYLMKEAAKRLAAGGVEEPTEAMIEAGAHELMDYPERETIDVMEAARKIYLAMARAALNTSASPENTRK